MKGLIVSAGKGSRFGGEKALTKINGIENIVRTYNLMKPKVEDIYITVREDKQDLYKAVLPDAKYVLMKESKGSGQAVRDSLWQLPEATYLITWGDMLFRDMNFIPSIINTSRFNLFVQKENDAYVGYDFNKNGDVTKVNFYANQPNKPEWCWQDKGVFIAKRDKLLPYLDRLQPSPNGEYDFLYIVDDMAKDNPAQAHKLENSGIYTYNTKEQLEDIIKKWKNE